MSEIICLTEKDSWGHVCLVTWRIGDDGRGTISSYASGHGAPVHPAPRVLKNLRAAQAKVPPDLWAHSRYGYRKFSELVAIERGERKP